MPLDIKKVAPHTLAIKYTVLDGLCNKVYKAAGYSFFV